MNIATQFDRQSVIDEKIRIARIKELCRNTARVKKEMKSAAFTEIQSRRYSLSKIDNDEYYEKLIERII